MVSTRIGPDAQFQGARQFVIDFAGPKFDAIPEDKPPVAIANCSGGAHLADTFVTAQPVPGHVARDFEDGAAGRHQRGGGFALLAATGRQGGG